MKKLFTVLAVLLVASMVFAVGFSGAITAKYTFDFDKKSVTYAKPNKKGFDVSFAWDSGKLSIGSEADTHIEVAAVAGVEGWYLWDDFHAPNYNPAKAGQGEWASKIDAIDEFNAVLKLKVKTFKIVGKDWSVDFLNLPSLNFAKSAIDSYVFNEDYIEENEAFYSYDNSAKIKFNGVGFDGATVSYKGFAFGISFGANDWKDTFNTSLTVVTPEFNFGDVTVKGGVGYAVANHDYFLSASASAAYATDKMSVSGAYDLGYAKGGVNDNGVEFDGTVLNDLTVKFDLAPVTVDVYFANEGSYAVDKYMKYFDDFGGHKDLLPSNYLSAKVVVDVARVAENVPVTVTLTGANLLNSENQDLSIKATTTIVPDFEFGLYFNDWFDYANRGSGHQKLGATVKFTGIQNVTLNAGVAYRFARTDDELKKLYLSAGAEYVHDLFTATADVALEKVYEQSAVAGAILGAKSTTLVDGAELSAKAYFNLFDLDTFDTDDDNKLVLACKVTF